MFILEASSPNDYHELPLGYPFASNDLNSSTIQIMTYNWQQPDWPNFKYDASAIQDVLFDFAEKAGHVSGILKSLPDNIQTDAIIDLMVSEAIKTSEIAGEYLSKNKGSSIILML